MMSRGNSRRRGAAAVEFALLLPLLLVLAAAAVDFARVYHYSQVVTDCARTGALYASNPDVADRSPYLTAEEAALAGATDLTPAPQVVVGEWKDSAGNRCAEVTVTYSCQLLTRFGGVPSPMKIERTAWARLYPAATLDSGG